ncbi:alkaline phosphatase, tissue-nonspecific isozyme-like [Branchiostoma floridae]|uniref:Alkaline phosphatase, tissue-nonspecific isozyme n=1 Tax=Branchiostoma floridae TaxID=7739 RepID=A0A9J7M9Q4_BRAFL|nr:alkaline phosphatase, tissue-nonspecific isozyme-like [Branchiostoma floridae]
MFGASVKFVLSVAVWLSSWTLNCSAQTEEEKQPEYWNNLAWQDIQDVLQLQPRTGVAKNLVLFLGDGMGVSTVTAGRILKGQLAGRTGEEELLEMDKLPYSALVKTYNVDRQTGDSAGTATAYLSGVKANYGTVGVDATVARGDCAASFTAKTTSILEHAHAAGKSVGIVATARVTHATPAGTYAYAANRAWEHDGKMPSEAKALGCTDIAQQLVEDNPFIKVILGGGRGYFTSTDQSDPEYPDQTGFRTDGRDLIQEWQDGKQGAAARYVWRKAEFDQVDPAETDFLMGLFEPDHMQYSLDNEDDPAGEPTIAEMTTKAIQILSKNPNGFFLLVEGSKIDLGHHFGLAAHALNDLVAFNDAIAVGKNMLDLDETLITVTADHSHMFGFGGYAPRGTPILGIVPKSDDNIVLDGMPFTNILYGNGPGGSLGGRQNLTGVDTADKNYRQQAAVPMKYESHGGEDVSVFADGPMAHLFRGLHEQVYVAHVMKYAACIGEYTEKCRTSRNQTSAGDQHTWSGFTVFITLLLLKTIIN